MKYTVGQRVTGVVNNITDLGIFLTLPDNRHGLIFHDDFKNQWPRQRSRYHKGDKLRVVVVNVYKGKISLSLQRVNEPDLVDSDNQFNNLAPQKFDEILSKVLVDDRERLKELKDDM